MPGTHRDIRITLYRDALSTRWGIRIAGGKDLKQPLTIQRVVVGSPAEGELMPGDMLVELQEQDATQLSHADAENVIRRAGGSLNLRIKRFYSGTPAAQVVKNSSLVIQSKPRCPTSRNISFAKNDMGVDYNQLRKQPSHLIRTQCQQMTSQQPTSVNEKNFMLNRLNNTLRDIVVQSNWHQNDNLSSPKYESKGYWTSSYYDSDLMQAPQTSSGSWNLLSLGDHTKNQRDIFGGFNKLQQLTRNDSDTSDYYSTGCLSNDSLAASENGISRKQTTNVPFSLERTEQLGISDF